MVDVCLVGTGGMMPLPQRALTCLWMEYKGHAALIDCGEGTQIALRKLDVKLCRLEVIMITHTHGDHVLGLPGLLLTLSNLGKTSPLTIYGPKGLMCVISYLCCTCPMLPFAIQVIELDEDQRFFAWSDFTIETLALKHSMPCLGYRMTLNRLPVFDPQKARKNGIPQKYWERLHRGETITDGDKTYTTADVTKGKRHPTVICYMTDTVYFDEMVNFAKGADLLINEGMYGDLENIDRMSAKGHMLFPQAAELAAKAEVKQLWLTHYSPAFTDPHAYEDSVKKMFEQTVVCDDGQRISL